MNPIKRLSALTATLVAVLPPMTASAHVVLTERQAAAGAYHAASFRIGHGCGEAATTAVTVRLPDAVPTARPQPKPSWSISFGREPVDPPLSDHGKPLTERIRTVTWTGVLPPDQFDDFALLMALPSTPGDLAFAVTQTCGDQSVAWDGADAAHPAPVLTLLPATSGAHQH
ncbi:MULTISPECIES: YcnI family copper-binding membrane protein [unclassified Brevundimonas]|uniref:YcnI family copper-binding membrane protein n=1 Tax=unclassified Brevundimonas TaxID=2622653 RepID=UPI003F8F55E2